MTMDYKEYAKELENQITKMNGDIAFITSFFWLIERMDSSQFYKFVKELKFFISYETDLNKDKITLMIDIMDAFCFNKEKFNTLKEKLNTLKEKFNTLKDKK